MTIRSLGITLALAFVGLSAAQADARAIQAAVDAAPGRMVYVSAGDHVIDAPIRLTHDRSGLWGPGRIIQSNPDAPIVDIVGAADVEIRDLTLTRAAGRMETEAEGLQATDCPGLVVANVRVLDNHSSRAAIGLHGCPGAQVRDCLVRNYHRVAVDDRTRSPLYGYAFNCIAGFGIETEHASAVLIQGNRVTEQRLRATPELKEEYRLGQFVKKNPVKGTLMTQEFWDGEYAQNWHQGSAILVNAPKDAENIRILGNYVSNAGQGVDIHADRVILAQNIVENAHVGMKAMHGSRHVLILGNQFIKNDLWSIGLFPGSASHGARPARPGQRAQPDNGDGGSIVADNIISDFGHGDSSWVWGLDNAPIKLDKGPLAENPPITDVVIEGNIVYDADDRPRYRHAVRFPADTKGLQFSGNLFHPGSAGVSNAELNP